MTELELIKTEIVKAHLKYPLGVCLTHDIHSLFHDNYGYGNNTKKQFALFISNLVAGKFSDTLKKKNITLNINKELISKILA
jgi:hypothetical protein